MKSSELTIRTQGRASPARGRNQRRVSTPLALIPLALVALGAMAQAQGTAPAGGVGVNLTSNGAFVNLLDQSNRFVNASAFDSKGWPMSDFELVVMDGRPATEWNGQVDDPDGYRVDYSGTYKCSFVGQATLSASGDCALANESYDNPTNTTTFDLTVGQPGPNHAFVHLTFSNTLRGTSGQGAGITNLRINRPGYPLATTKVFTDEYLALCRSADFACYRYYTLQNVWGGEETYPNVRRWSERKLPTHASQAPMTGTSGNREGWSWEYIIRLANILDKDIWINIHMSCDTDYVTRLAEKLRAELNPGIHIYVENSNEVWSPSQATHGPYNQADATAEGISFDQNYARRTVELSQIFRGVFGAAAINDRIRVVLASQASYLGRSNNHLDYINSTIGPPKDTIYATSPALYFGSDSPDGTPAQINAGMLTNLDSQIAQRLQHIQLAQGWGLTGGAISYEGGAHLPAGGGQTNLGNQIRAHRTPEMRTILTRNLRAAWFDLGGGLAMHFTLCSGYNRYGAWGLTDDYTNPHRNHKMAAMVDLVGAWSGSAGNGGVTPPVTSGGGSGSTAPVGTATTAPVGTATTAPGSTAPGNTASNDPNHRSGCSLVLTRGPESDGIPLAPLVLVCSLLAWRRRERWLGGFSLGTIDLSPPEASALGC
jgi:hypothetical protein